MFTGNQLSEFCKGMIGQPYWYKCVLTMCSEQVLKNRAMRYPEHYKCDISKVWDKLKDSWHVAMDNIGLIQGFFWSNGGEGVKEYLRDGKPFKVTLMSGGLLELDVESLFKRCQSESPWKYGKLDTMPELAGVMLFRVDHKSVWRCGVYIGDGYVVESCNMKDGVVKTRRAARRWDYWALLPKALIDYGCTVDVQSYQFKLGNRVLSSGMQGADVISLQEMVNKHESRTLAQITVNGVYDERTVSAIKCIQRFYGIKATGAYDVATQRVFKKY